MFSKMLRLKNNKTNELPRSKLMRHQQGLLQYRSSFAEAFLPSFAKATEGQGRRTRVQDFGLGGDAAADAGRAGHTVLQAIHKEVPDGARACARATCRGARGVARLGLQSPRQTAQRNCGKSIKIIL